MTVTHGPDASFSGVLDLRELRYPCRQLNRYGYRKIQAESATSLCYGHQHVVVAQDKSEVSLVPGLRLGMRSWRLCLRAGIRSCMVAPQGFANLTVTGQSPEAWVPSKVRRML